MLLGPFGLGDYSILADPSAAMAALVSNAVWRDSAFAMIILLAGLKSIPGQLYAAARVDGAGVWMRFTRITLPLIRVPILIAVVRLLIHFVNVLTFALILTGGGPNNATQTLGLAMYRLGFIEFRLGEANALAILVFVFNILLIACNLALFRQRRTYQA
jgi:ABC-type sugar transport system permease subunit